MPHSSGGGSHSGGSHSGSGFSGSSSSSGGSSAKHIKHTSFPGARRYVYYENYRPVYVYADYDIRKGTASGKFFSILGSAVSLLFGIMLLAMCYDKPQKMDTSPSYHCEIKDTAGVIDDKFIGRRLSRRRITRRLASQQPFTRRLRKKFTPRKKHLFPGRKKICIL